MKQQTIDVQISRLRKFKITIFARLTCLTKATYEKQKQNLYERDQYTDPYLKIESAEKSRIIDKIITNSLQSLSSPSPQLHIYILSRSECQPTVPLYSSIRSIDSFIYYIYVLIPRVHITHLDVTSACINNTFKASTVCLFDCHLPDLCRPS